MTWFIMATIIVGTLLGYSGFLGAYLNTLDQITTWALCLLIMGVGMELGQNREVWVKIKALGLKIILVPFCIALGTILGTTIAGFLLNLPFNESSAIGAGFGWYSLSGVLIAKMYNAQTGAIAFLTNVFREILAIFFIPIVAAKIGKLTAVAPGGATSMDTTLPFVTKAAGAETGLVSFISGAVLSSLVPILVPLLINLKF